MEVAHFDKMPGKPSKKRDLDDIQVLGVWNFTIQPETPLVWLRTGPLDRYLLKFVVSCDCPSTAGMIFHAEADGPGIDGASFWIERRLQTDGSMTRRYMLAGDGLESKPLATKSYPDPGGEATEEVELLVQGFTACIFVRNRQVQIKCRTKASRGSICFYNSTKSTEDGKGEDVHFSNCRITALRRGPLEVGGTLARRERALEPRPAVDETALDPLNIDSSVVFGDSDEKSGTMNFHDSVATTAPPESTGGSMHLTKSAAATTSGNFFKSSPGATRGGPGFRATVGATRGAFGQPGGSPVSSNRNALFSHRPGAGAGRGMRATLSDSALRKSGVALCGLSPATQARGFGGGQWVSLATQPPKSEQSFVREHAIRPLPAGRNNACEDFIKMDTSAVRV